MSDTPPQSRTEIITTRNVQELNKLDHELAKAQRKDHLQRATTRTLSRFAVGVIVFCGLSLAVIITIAASLWLLKSTL